MLGPGRLQQVVGVPRLCGAVGLGTRTAMDLKGGRE